MMLGIFGSNDEPAVHISDTKNGMPGLIETLGVHLLPSALSNSHSKV